jgi:solute carrier family 39 (zinc transporter), member 7
MDAAQVLLHEIPHEIGDFTILVQSGFGIRDAIVMQFCTASAAFIGTFLGLCSHRYGGTDTRPSDRCLPVPYSHIVITVIIIITT